MTPLRILVVGHVTHDRLGDGAQARIVAGGSAYYASRVYRSLGAKVTLATAVGHDFACEEVFAGLDVVAERDGRTTEFRNLYAEDGTRLQTIGGQAASVAPGEEEREPFWDLVHLAPVLGEIDLAAWEHATRARMLGIGVQGWIKVASQTGPDGRCRVVPRPWAIEPEALRGIDMACLSDEDLVEQGDLLDRLRASVPIVALTHGPLGAELFDDSRVTQVGVHPTTTVDPTGAGDVFAAALMHEVARGSDPIVAARLAAATASIVIEAEGARALSRLDEAAGRAAAIQASTRAI
jgi:sugar/nucleoside kinase (ribokinase family)